MFCEKCGNEIAVGAKFCGRCGAPVMQSTETPVVPVTPEKKEIPVIPETPEQKETPVVPRTPEQKEVPFMPETPELKEAEGKGKKNPVGVVAKILAGISAVLLLAGLPLPYFSAEGRTLLLYDYLGLDNFRMNYFLFVLIFAGIFVLFKVMNRRKLAFIGCIGIWVEAAFLLFTTLTVVNGYASIYNTAYILGMGFYLHIGGVVLQLIAAVMNGSGAE